MCIQQASSYLQCKVLMRYIMFMVPKSLREQLSSVLHGIAAQSQSTHFFNTFSTPLMVF